MNKVKLSIGDMQFTIELFDHPIADKLFEQLPQTIALTCWGDEAYGELGIQYQSHKPQPAIPGGGLAYSEQGTYLCLFYGQTPAWPVDYIGQIKGDEWKALRGQPHTAMTLEKN